MSKVYLTGEMLRFSLTFLLNIGHFYWLYFMKTALETSESVDLSHLHRDLSVVLDTVEELIMLVAEIRDRVSLVVLETDIMELIDECEEYMILDKLPSSFECLSLKDRSETIIDEAKALLRDM